MRSKLFGTMIVAAAMLAGYSAYDAQKEYGLSDTVLANVEALADNEAMTSEEYREKYGCDAVIYEATCIAKDGKKHIYAIQYVE